MSSPLSQSHVLDSSSVSRDDAFLFLLVSFFFSGAGVDIVGLSVAGMKNGYVISIFFSSLK